MENTEKEKRFVILGKTSNGGGGGGGEGTVTSVGISVPIGLNVIGSPVTSSGIIQIGFANGYSIPTTAKQAEWDAKSDFSGSYNDLTNKPTLATVATTGSYNDLSNKPTIPTKTSDLTNDSGYVVGTSLSSVATSGDYDDLTNKPTIPSKTSDLTNDSGFISQLKTINNESLIGTGNLTIDTFSGDYNDLSNKPTIPTKTSDLTNDSGYVIGTSLSSVATSGSYNDLSDTPTIPTVNDATITITQGGVTKGTFTTNQSGNSTITLDAGGGSGTQVQSDWTETDSTSMAYILHKPTIPSKTSDLTNDSGFVIDTSLSSVATSGSYNDLTDKPTIPTVGNGTITITQGGVTKGTFTTNQSGDSTITLDAGGGGGTQVQSDWTETDSTSMAYILHKPTIPSKTSDLTNDSGFISQIKTINNESLIGTGNLTIDTFSGDYDDLTNKPTIPTKTSDLTNDSGFVVGSNLATVAISGSYNDLSDTPTIPTNTSDLTNDSGFINQLKTINNESLIGTGNITIGSGGTQVQSDWTETDSTSMAYILHKPTLSIVATTGDYDDLTNKPTIPTNTSDLTNDSGFISQIKTINNESLIGTGNLTIDTFSGDYNDLTNKPTIPTKTSDLTNDSNFVVGSTLATVATSGSYNDLSNTPTIPTKTSDLTNDSNFVVGSALATVATTGSYDDLSDKPTIPTVNDATITITQGGTTKGTFTLNQSTNATIALDAGGSGGNTRDTWYGSQEQFDAIPENQLDTNTDYYISGNIQWNDIANKPTIPTAVSQLENDNEYTTIHTVKSEINKALRVFGDRVQYVTQSEFDSLSQSGALKDDVTYFIQDSTDNTIQMDVVFSDNTTATYNVYINN